MTQPVSDPRQAVIEAYENLDFYITEFRDEHLALAWKAADAGELVLGGALEEPVEQAMVLFRGSRDAALRFAAADPYVKNGLVKAFKVKQWNTVAGAAAANPVRPKA